MSGQAEPTNGVYVRYREWRAACEADGEWKREMREGHKATDKRVDDLERKWDRIAGPIMIGVTSLSVLALVSNLAVIWLR